MLSYFVDSATFSIQRLYLCPCLFLQTLSEVERRFSKELSDITPGAMPKPAPSSSASASSLYSPHPTLTVLKSTSTPPTSLIRGASDAEPARLLPTRCRQRPGTSPHSAQPGPVGAQHLVFGNGSSSLSSSSSTAGGGGFSDGRVGIGEHMCVARGWHEPQEAGPVSTAVSLPGDGGVGIEEHVRVARGCHEPREASAVSGVVATSSSGAVGTSRASGLDSASSASLFNNLMEG